MGKSNNNISSSPEGMPRPSLLTSTAPASNHNILDAMAGQAPLSTASQRPRWLAWLLVPLLAATAWGISTELQKPLRIQPVTQAPTRTATALVVAQVLPATSATVAISDAATATNPFNTLDVPAATDAQPAAIKPAQAPAAFDMQAALNATTPAVQPTVTAKTPPATVKTAAATPAPKPAEAKTPVSKPKVAKAPPPLTDKKTAAKASTSKPVAAPPSSKSPSPDRDVELLSAIMKHLGNESAPAPQPRSSQTIAELVKSCHRKDAIEAMLCQRRICEGSWGKAQACPQNLAPKPSNNGSLVKAPA